ncbi:hypothetical protein [Blastochloris viridis]|uniref:Uncharacterized protein n=1 Tax=Blastochloris viridis TaxID=1079 RepID=A0A0P0JI31_BLAVI|nr:hypothetical protein [Blastochloris viridis]ALK08813.1 hypothetical protein BVIR_1022 [Blastochloris viridis]CUU41474.1 hypothetical protein BVIRIDIS_04650 [Blastochloris viridis]
MIREAGKRPQLQWDIGRTRVADLGCRIARRRRWCGMMPMAGFPPR